MIPYPHFRNVFGISVAGSWRFCLGNEHAVQEDAARIMFAPAHKLLALDSPRVREVREGHRCPLRDEDDEAWGWCARDEDDGLVLKPFGGPP